MVIGFSVMIASALPHKLLYAQTHRTNCTLEIMERRCKAIPTLIGLDPFYFSTECMKTILGS